MICAGCSTGPSVVQAPEIIVAVPPEALMQPCVSPEGDIVTNRDLVVMLGDTRTALASCGAMVDGVRAWRNANAQPVTGLE